MTARVFFLISALATIALAKTIPEDSKLVSQFEEFIKEYDKNYADEIEKAMRFGMFVKNLDYIDHLNKHSETATFGVTQFADMTKEEFLRQYTGYMPHDENGTCKVVSDVGNTTTVTEFDWRLKKAVTRVKDQKRCGSCWAFSAIGNMEGVHAIKSGKLVDLSAQQLVDCDTKSDGCFGGLMTFALSYLKEKGSVSDADYSYEAERGSCRYDKSKVVVTPKDCHILNVTEDVYARKLQEIGPLSIAIDAMPLMKYKGGILSGDSCEGTELNHGVLLVGFGEDKGKKYWIVKNSWGEKFGEKGYFRMERGVNCLLVTNAPPVTAVM